MLCCVCTCTAATLWIGLIDRHSVQTSVHYIYVRVPRSTFEKLGIRITQLHHLVVGLMDKGIENDSLNFFYFLPLAIVVVVMLL